MNRLTAVLLAVLTASTCLLAEGRRYRVMTYNVENLFDTCHDNGKSDEEFLPDGERKWNSWRYWKKLGDLARVVAAAGGEVLIKNVIPKHLECITAKLLEMGVDVEERDDAVLVRRTGKLTRTNVKTLPYPGFPTDMQPQIAAVLCLAEGTSVITEGVWDNRFRYVDEFRRMGAQIQVDGKIAVIEGVEKFTGARIQACDLRAGAAMVIAGLAAQGTTEIGHIHHIERGYEDIVRKLSGVGADIRVVVTPDEEKQAQVG